MDIAKQDYQLIKAPKRCYLNKCITELSQVPHSFCSTYLIALKNLFNEIKKASNIQSKRDIFNAFTNKYTTVPDIWMAWKDAEKECINDLESFLQNKEIFKKLKEKCLEHFHMGYDFDRDVIFDFIFDERTAYNAKFDVVKNKYYEIFKNVKELNHFCEPQNHILSKQDIYNNSIVDFWKNCEEYSTMEIPKSTKRKVEEYIFVAEHLKGANSDDSKWMEILVKNGSKECVIDFIKNRIYKNPYNQNMWKLYILYLEEQPQQNIFDILNVYSRYCRLFIDDISTRKQYYEITTNLRKNNNQNLSKWIMDIVKIEADFVSLNSSKKMMEQFFPGIIILKPNDPNLFFAAFKQKIIEWQEEKTEKEGTNPQQILYYQNFCFPVSMIRSIINSANASEILKLQKCCKYFFKKINAILIHKLSLTEIEQNFMYQNSVFINRNNYKKFKMNNKIWLTNSLNIDMGYIYEHAMSLSEFLIPKIYKCNIRFLNITYQRLTDEEFDYLTKSKSIESLRLCSASIKKSDGKEYCLEEIIERCPNGYKFWLSDIPCTSNTAKILSSLNHKTKIKAFNYSYATEEFDIDDFSNFVMKNGTAFSMFTVKFTQNIQHWKIFFDWVSAETKPSITKWPRH